MEDDNGAGGQDVRAHDFFKLFTPWLMRSAFQKVETWYHWGEWVDPAEWLDWKAHPLERLNALAVELATNTYKPSPFPMVPYPKKGGRTRHYLMPSVKDQVAFMALTLILAPFLEAQMPNVSFGNRLFRPRIPWLETKGMTQRWIKGPFSLAESRLYDPFESGYGLFRRVLQWLTNASVLSDGMQASLIRDLDAEPRDLLPYYNFLSHPLVNGGTDLLTARLDIKLAYPSVDRTTLASRLIHLVKGTREAEGHWGLPSFPELHYQNTDNSPALNSYLEAERPGLARHPWHLLGEREDLREAIATRLGTLVGCIEYAPWQEPQTWGPGAGKDILDPGYYLSQHPDGGSKSGDQWDPHGMWPVDCHLTTLGTKRFGIPTGLAISGVLLNVVLSQVDEALCQRHEEALRHDRTPILYLRFVDDIVLLAASKEDLQDNIEILQEELALASPSFRLSTNKAKPEAIKTFLMSEDAEKHLEVPLDQRITRANVERYVTNIVRETSDLDSEGIEEIFGAPGIDRLLDLMELAERTTDDPEVLSESRVAFALLRLANASWPSTAVLVGDREMPPEAFANHILFTAEKAVRGYPWRYKLLRSALICGIRASLVGPPDSNLGEPWMYQHLLPLLQRTGQKSHRGRVSQASWEDIGDYGNTGQSGGQAPGVKVTNRRSQHWQLRGSFRRAYFWRTWAQIVRALHIVAQGETASIPGSWTWHMTQQQATSTMQWFGDFAKWAKLLYPDPDGGDASQLDPFLWWWESEAIQDALLATMQPTVRLLRGLGNPSAQAIRWSLSSAFLKKLEEYTGLIWLKAAFRHVLGHEGSTNIHPSLSVEPRDCSTAMLWSTLCAPTAGNSPLADRHVVPPALRPARNQSLAWAALARFGNWEHWPAVKVLLRKALDPPVVLPNLDSCSLWNDVLRLDAYHYIRRLRLAHGDTVKWGSFAHWFSGLAGQGADAPEAPETLLDDMYRLEDMGTTLSDAYVPALELPSFVAWPLLLASETPLRAIPKAGGFIAPDCIVLRNKSAIWIRSYRKSLLRPLEEQPPSINRSKSPRFLVEAVLPLSPSRRAPHPMFLLPSFLGLTAEACDKWRLVCLFLWLLGGGEADLNRLWLTAPWYPPLSDREAMRSRYLLDQRAWIFIEEGLKSKNATTWLGAQSPRHSTSGESRQTVAYVTLSSEGGWSLGAITPADRALAEHFRLRLIQILNTPTWGTVFTRTQGMLHDAGSAAAFGSLSHEIAERFAEAKARATMPTDQLEREDMMMFPEWSVPYYLARRIRKFVRETGIGVLAGLTPRELPPAVPAVKSIVQRGPRFLVNEAILALPSPARKRLPWDVHVFYIRKPHASVDELGLIAALTGLGRTARFACGSSWWQFSHPTWGDFSPVICSELLDPSVAQSLKGRLHHLLVVAWNQDIDLFDQFTWTRGYELYANVASVNHGSYGGSVVWTPKHGPEKELLRVHGRRQGLAMVVDMPVRTLDEAQRTQLAESIEHRRLRWIEQIRGTHDQDGSKNVQFKAPPPDYSRK